MKVEKQQPRHETQAREDAAAPRAHAAQLKQSLRGEPYAAQAAMLAPDGASERVAQEAAPVQMKRRHTKKPKHGKPKAHAAKGDAPAPRQSDGGAVTKATFIADLLLDCGSYAGHADVELAALSSGLDFMIDFSADAALHEVVANADQQEIKDLIKSKKDAALRQAVIDLAFSIPSGIGSIKAGLHVLKEGIASVKAAGELVEAGKGVVETGEKAHAAYDEAYGEDERGTDAIMLSSLEHVGARVSDLEAALVKQQMISVGAHFGHIAQALDDIGAKLGLVAGETNAALASGAALGDAVLPQVAALERRLDGLTVGSAKLAMLAKGYDATAGVTVGDSAGVHGVLSRSGKDGRDNPLRGLFDALSEIKARGAIEHLQYGVNRNVTSKVAMEYHPDPYASGLGREYIAMSVSPCDYYLKGFVTAAKAAGIADPEGLRDRVGKPGAQLGGDAVAVDARLLPTLSVFLDNMGLAELTTTYNGTRADEFPGAQPFGEGLARQHPSAIDQRDGSAKVSVGGHYLRVYFDARVWDLHTNGWFSGDVNPDKVFVF